MSRAARTRVSDTPPTVAAHVWVRPHVVQLEHSVQRRPRGRGVVRREGKKYTCSVLVCVAWMALREESLPLAPPLLHGVLRTPPPPPQLASWRTLWEVHPHLVWRTNDRQGATLIPLSHPKSAFVATPRPRCDGSRPHHALPACGGRIAHDTSASFVLWPGGRVHNHLHVHRRARLLPLCAARPLTERPPSAPVTVRGKHGKHQGRVSAVGCGSKSNLLCKLRRTTYQLKAIQPWYEFRPIGAARSLMPPGGALPLLRHRATGVLLVLLGVQ